MARGCFAVALVALAAVLSSGEVETLDMMQEAPPDVAADVKHAMKKAAEAANSKALAETAKEVDKADEKVKEIETPRGIPPEVVDALSTKHLGAGIRTAIEAMALPKPSKDSSPEKKVEAENAQRIMEATANAVASPEITKKTEKVTKEVLDKEVHQVEAKAQFEKKVEETVEKAAGGAEKKAKVQAEKLLKKAEQTQRVLVGLEKQGKLGTATAEKTAKEEIEKARGQEQDAKEYLQKDADQLKDKEVAKEVKKVMEQETDKLKGQLVSKAEDEVKQKLAREGALQAEKELRLKAEEAETKAAAQAAADASKAALEAKSKAEDHTLLTVQANKNEAASFGEDVALNKVGGYWSSRRRFAQQKHFVKYGSFNEAPKPLDSDKNATKAAQVLLKKEDAKIKQDQNKEATKLIESEMEKDLPKGAVQKMVNKLAKKQVLVEADKITAETDVKAEGEDVDQAVKNVIQMEQKMAAGKSTEEPVEQAAAPAPAKAPAKAPAAAAAPAPAPAAAKAPAPPPAKAPAKAPAAAAKPKELVSQL